MKLLNFIKRLFFKKDVAAFNEECSRVATIMMNKWIDFDKEIVLKDGFGLVDKIELFIQPISLYVENNHPLVKRNFWKMLFIGIMSSGTHDTEEVKKAIPQLALKYGGVKFE